MRIPRAISFLLLAGAATSPLLAADTPKFKVFGAASYMSPLGESDIDFGAVRDSVEAADQLGWTVGFEARFNPVLGLEVDYINATSDIEFAGETIGDVDMQPLSATLNFHLIPTSIVDLYVGPTATYFIFSDA
ncbi:MAG TPA: hypothetical protein VFP98_07360, partial [Candidatus Polarisedimenticolia bacterium]|nr:hypothetical protein [Candidatus Polarisedimenticolia bacterium]